MSTDFDAEVFNAQVRKVALLKAEIKNLETQVAETLAELGELDFRQYPAGDYILEVQHNWALDKSKVRASLKPGQIRQVQKTDIDTTKVKALFPEVYQESMKHYPNPRKYVIKDVTDA